MCCVYSLGFQGHVHPTYSLRSSPNASFPPPPGQALVKVVGTDTYVLTSPPWPDRVLLEAGNGLGGQSPGLVLKAHL